jgi:transcriptional regulator of arginine metabolism
LIISIIRNEKIHNQDDLREKLRSKGLDVTQATLSRDIRVLGVVKVYDRDHGYIYAQPEPLSAFNETEMSIMDREDLIKGIRDIQFSGNLAIIKTKLGHATGVAFEIDRLRLPDVIGTIGGDDTLLVVLKEGADREVFLKRLRD